MTIHGENLLAIGKVVKPHGVTGKIKVDYFGEDINHIPPFREVFIEDSKGQLKKYEVLKISLQSPRLILQLKGINSREEVRTLIGKEILIDKGILPALGEDEYYWFEIIGMVVETEGERRIGRVKEIFQTKANDVYVIEGKRGEILLPAVKEVIESVDIKRRVMRVRRMEGLWEEEDEI